MQRARRVTRPDEHQLAPALRDEPHAAQDEGAHQDLAQLRIALNQGAQVFAVDHHHLAVLRDPPSDQSPPPRQHVDLAREFPGALQHHALLVVAHGPQDLELPADHDEERRVAIPDLEHHLTGPDSSALAETCDAVYLSRREPGKHLRAAVGGGIGHVAGPGLVLGPGS